MAYTAWSVVYGEQPTAAKWNQLGANDAGFKDASNIDALAITGAKIAANTLTGDKIAAGAIDLGQAQITANISTTSTSFVDMAGLSKAVTVPSGSRRVKVSFAADRWACSSVGVGIYAQILCDGVVIGTYTVTAHNTANGALAFTFFTSHVPTAGSHTYKMQWKTDGGTLSLTAGALQPAQILVEAI
jgi:hypothetical protein